MPIFSPDGTILSSQIQRTLSRRDAELMRDITRWEMGRDLQPTLICKHCYEHHHHDVDKKDHWSVQVAATAGGGITAWCECTRWTMET